MTYSSKIMFLMMGLSKNLKSHTSISTKYNMGTQISHIYVAYRPLHSLKMELRAAEEMSFDRGCV